MGNSAKCALSATIGLWMIAGAVSAAAPAGEVHVVELADSTPRVSVGGTVIPYKEVTFAAQLPGRVKYLAGIEGDSFEAGDLLVSLDAAELLAKRQALMAQVATADAQIRNAGVQYSRELFSPRSRNSPGGMALPNLFDQMFTRPMEEFIGDRDQGAELSADLYDSGTRVQEAQHAMMRLQAELRALDSKLRDARSIAPFDGVIVKKYIEVGDTVQPGQPLLNYADIEYLQVEVDIPARLRPNLREGMMLSAELDVPRGKAGMRAPRAPPPFPGMGADGHVPVRVAQIFPMADPQRHTVKIKLDLPQGVSEPGMYAKVLIPDFGAPARVSPVIPRSAIRYNGSLPGVYVLDDDGRPQLRLIRLGEPVPDQDNAITVLSGLRAGERIVVNPGPGVTGGWSRGGEPNR
jgi:RND family efflux transporter MFP subunit